MVALRSQDPIRLLVPPLDIVGGPGRSEVIEDEELILERESLSFDGVLR
jgi:hypothetical protein